MISIRPAGTRASPGGHHGRGVARSCTGLQGHEWTQLFAALVDTAARSQSSRPHTRLSNPNQLGRHERE